MVYRICKAFEVESGHMLFKHPEKCRYPHGHSRRVEVVVASAELDANDMACDFAALKMAINSFVDRFDHSLAVNSQDPIVEKLSNMAERLVVFKDQDPTTEVLAKFIFDHLVGQISSGRDFTGPMGQTYRLPRSLLVERVRVGETSSSWAEYGR